jgi:hypothetical protein
MENIFENIMSNCHHKKVQSLCKKLIKKLSFNSGKDIENLCHLIYWLYIFGNVEEAKKCINLTHEIEFTQNYNIWTFIHLIWGLEIRILRQEGNNKLADDIAEKMDKQLKMPTEIETPEKAEIRENRRRKRIDIKIESNETEIAECLRGNDIKTANEYRFVGIMGLIGTMETGFFPELNKNREKIEEIIKEYVKEIIKYASIAHNRTICAVGGFMVPCG